MASRRRLDTTMQLLASTRLLAVCALLALGACFNPSPSPGAACGSGAWCPSGLVCDLRTYTCEHASGVSDAGPPIDAWRPPPDAWSTPDAALSSGIVAARTLPMGEALVSIDSAVVTFVKPALGDEPEGFFIQEDPEGLGLFVVSPTDLPGLRITPGDRIRFDIKELGDVEGVRAAVDIGPLLLLERDVDIAPFELILFDLDDAADNSFYLQSRLISISLNVWGPMSQAGELSYVGVGNDRYLRMLGETALALRPTGCFADLYLSVLWFTEGGEPVPTMWSMESAIDQLVCGRTGVQQASVVDDNTIELRFDRSLTPSTVAADGSQFSFANDALQVSAAQLSGRVVTLTTSTMEPNQSYELTVDTAITDFFGRNLDNGRNRVTVNTGNTPALLHINEVKANIAPGCDLVELRVVQGGQMEGIVLRDRTTPVLTFTDWVVETNDIIVVHFDRLTSYCKRDGDGNETDSVTQYPRSDTNFDTAYDWYTDDLNISQSDTTLLVVDADGDIIDAALMSGTTATNPFEESEIAAAQAAEAGEWQDPDGEVPGGGFRGAAFHANAASGLELDPINVIGGFGPLENARSVQRVGNADTNNKTDFSAAVQTFGLLNAGQAPF
ncbi:hypothetical protein Hoch_5945 [Haliangium ochraceum DSM 14365]|uniref:Uncharacterized protein n=2 Tax=Haliangium ochraceum TaxID=80816 RepID=D0LJR3_HALO1|nr:hypothetical protein Hoch_5945 [Haliangium ochraceum DSM 14365]